jgi:hypothetical protein
MFEDPATAPPADECSIAIQFIRSAFFAANRALGRRARGLDSSSKARFVTIRTQVC